MSVLSRTFDKNVPAKEVVGLEHHPAMAIIHNDLLALMEAMGMNTQALAAYTGDNADLLKTYLAEGGNTPAGQLVTTFDAQTHDVELVTAVISYIPATATSAFLTMDDWKIPLPVGEINNTGLELPVRSTKRTLTMTGIGATDSAFIMVNARPAPANMLGLLH